MKLESKKESLNELSILILLVQQVDRVTRVDFVAMHHLLVCLIAHGIICDESPVRIITIEH